MRHWRTEESIAAGERQTIVFKKMLLGNSVHNSARTADLEN